MADSTARLKIQIEADMAEAKAYLEQINKVVLDIDPSAQVAAQSLRDVDSSLSSLQGVVLGAATAFLSLRTAMMAIQVSDDYNQMASRIKMVTANTEEYAMVQERLMEVADRTYKPLSTIQELFVRSSSSMKELGYSTKETVDFIDSISSSLTINSASADRANLAIAALNRSMTTGKVAAQEWEMVMNVMPTIAADIATYLRETGKEANATEQSVKAMAKEGKISMELFAEATIYANDKNAELAENMPTTFADAMTKLRNHLSAYLAETNDTIGATEKLVDAINFVTQHLDAFAKVVTAFAAGALARYSVALLQNTLFTIRTAAAKKALIAQELAVANAQFQATRAALAEAQGQAQATVAATAHQAALVRLVAAQKAASASMLALGLPGLAMTVASVAAGILLFRDNTDATKSALVDLNISLEEAIDKFNQLDSASKRNTAIANTKKTVKELKAEYAALVDQFQRIDVGLFTAPKILNAEEFRPLKAEMSKAVRDMLNGITVDWDELSESIKNSTAISEDYKNSQLSLIGDLRKKSEEIQKGIALSEKQEEANKKLSEQDKESAEAQRTFISAANNLDGELKKLTTSVDGSINSSRTMSETIALLEANLDNLKNTAGATPEKINELTTALDGLKKKQQELNNINNDKFIANLKKQNATAGMSTADKQRYDINNNKTWTDDKRKEALAEVAKGEAQENARKAAEKAKSTSESLAKSNLSYVEGLEKNIATMNLGKIATLEYELAQKQLSGALLERAKASIEVMRAAQQLANMKVNEGMQVELLRLTGNDYQADLLELETKFKETTEQLKKEGNDAGLVIAKNLFDAGKAKVQIDAVKKEIEKAFNNQNIAQQTIQAQVTAGQISQYEGQKRLTELHKQTAAVVKQYLPALEKAAQTPGAMGEQLKGYLTEVNNQLLVLETTTNELENAFRNGLQDGIQSSLEGLVKGTMDLQEALNNFLESIASNILNVVAQNIAQDATNGIMSGLGSLGSLFGIEATAPENESSPQALAISTASQEGALAMQMGIEQGAMMAAQTLSTVLSSMGATSGLNGLGGEAGLFGNITQNATEAVTAISGVTAAKTAADATITASATTSAATTQATTTAAATSAQAAWAPAAATAATASFGTAAMIGLAALMAVMTAVKAFATGGHVQGAGTGTSDSIPAWLSNGEFVTRSAVVKQPGMLAFMHDLNRHGWGAVDKVARAKHSTGGLAGIPAPSMPTPSSMTTSPVENVNNNSTTLKNSQNFYLVDDPNKFGDSINNNDHTKESIFIFLEQNQQRVNSIVNAG